MHKPESLAKQNNPNQTPKHRPATFFQHGLGLCASEHSSTKIKTELSETELFFSVGLDSVPAKLTPKPYL